MDYIYVSNYVFLFVYASFVRYLLRCGLGEYDLGERRMCVFSDMMQCIMNQRIF